MNDDTYFYKRLFELNSTPMLIYGDEGLLDCNAALLKLFNVHEKGSVVGFQLADLSPTFQPNGTPSQQMFNDLLQETKERGSVSIECLCNKLVGEEAFPAEVVVSSLTFPNKEIFQVTVLDLSHHHHWKDALQTKKELVELTLKAVDSAVITATRDGSITYMNKAACELTGWLQDEALGEQISTVLNVVRGDSDERIELCATPSTISKKEVIEIPSDAKLIAKSGQRIGIRGTSAVQGLSHSASIGYVITIVRNAARENIDGEMQWHATHDELTKLPNRLLLADRFKQAMFSAARHKTMLAVCMMDLDEFKPVNDTYGHAVGDQLLVEVAGRLKAHLRQEDTVARLGGDEFVILIGGVHNKPELFQMLQRIREAIAEPYSIENNELEISCSMGVTMYPEEDVDADMLLRHADQAMFAAKKAGRNRMYWFDSQQEQQLDDAQQVLSRLEQALTDNEFELYYQPKVNMRTGDILGMEALIRWVHPTKGIIPPMDFLPKIEHHELSVSVGEWVLVEALKQQAEWRKQGKDWSVSVNISARYFQLTSFSSRLKNIIKRHPQADASKIEIEILESMALKDIEHVQNVVKECNKLGVRLALDDFGTGYASLSYLKRLPVSMLKIDQSFIHDILDNKEDLALVQAMISLASTFNRSVIGEGVETVEHGALLMRLGCDVAQGYGIAKPMPASEVIAWANQFTPAPLWKAWQSSEWDLKVFPLLVAQYDIREWVGNVITKIEDESLLREHARINDEGSCRFGNWYDSEGISRYGELDIFKEIDPVHRVLHQLGDQITQLYSNNQIEEAHEKCKLLHKTKDELLTMLDRLQLKAFAIS